MNVAGGLDSGMRPIVARALLLGGLLLSLVPLFKRTPRTQAVVFVLPEWFRGGDSRITVAWTLEGDPEALGGFTMTFPDGAPASLRREISAPDGRYRLDVSLEHAENPKTTGRRSTRVEITRRLSLNGGEVRVVLENPPP